MAHVLFDLALQLVQLFDFTRIGELGQFLQIDHADLRRLGGFFELFQQPVDRLELFGDFDGLRHGHRCFPGELVLTDQFVHLVFVAQPCHELHQLPGKARAVIARAVPQPLQIANLLVVKRLVERLAKIARRLDRFTGLAIVLADGFHHAIGFVLRQDLALPLQQNGPQGLDAGPESGDLAGIEPNRPGQLLVGQLAHVAVHHQVIERRRHQIRRRLRRAGKVLGIVFLVGVNHTAQRPAIRHPIIPLPSPINGKGKERPIT